MLVTVTLLVVMSSIAARAEPMRCEIASKFSCSPAGCTTNKPSVFNIIDIELGKFSRCDANGCDEYSANFSRSGAYIIVDVPGRGTMAKLSADGTEYVEVATLGTTVLVSFGACRPQ
jgi:hypothetical protein